ncbi:MAG: TonB-dependent receptor domain-containing protein [Luteibaculum sp.]
MIDDASGETIIGASVVIEGTTTGASTDLDGKFEIKAQPGTYNIEVSFISFQRIKVSDVQVKSGEVTAMGTIRMVSDAEQLNEVVVTAKAVKNTEAALVTMKKKSANLIDGISAASFKKIGDSDAAGAMSRVTGVSVEGGKYVYVRGLGDRYTKTTLNGMEIPGLDPDRNTVQMDIFPTNIIDNIVVSKSFTADLPADFTGGAVDISLKDFPDEKTMNVGVGVGYNPAMHLNDQYITYNGGKTDFLGFDDGTREIPTAGNDFVPFRTDAVRDPRGPAGQRFSQIMSDFNPQMGGYQTTSPMNGDLSFSFANQKAMGLRSVGYSFALSYKNSTEFYEEAEYNLYGKAQNPDEKELTLLQMQRGKYGVNNVLLGGMAGVAIKSDRSKIKLNLLHLQNGERKTGEFATVVTDVGTEYQADQYNLEYSERSLTNVLVNGVHRFENDDWKLDWKVSPTRSSIEDPDIRFLRLGDGQEGGVISTQVGIPQRIWRYLDEVNVATKVDVTKETKLFGEDAKVKFGISGTYKNRDFNIENFSILPGNAPLTPDSEPNDLFRDEYLFDADNTGGVYYQADFIPLNPNKYNSFIFYNAAYGSLEFKPDPLLKAIVGLRAEAYNQYYTGINQNGDINLQDSLVLEDLDLFPTLNLIYNLTEKQNLRFSYSRTIARPSFKEMSFAEILDPITGRTFAGGLFGETTGTGDDAITLWDGNLRSTRINNFDIRWEVFPEIGQNISVSFFYKTFDAPIEYVQFLADPGTFQARNVGDATLYGAEFEIIQSLNKISEKLSKFNFNANITFAKSSIELSASEKLSRESSARTGEDVPDRRAMAGQAPYIINTGISYADREKGFDAGIFYNVQGPTLQFVGFGNQTDVYSVPFHSLNIKASKNFGKDDRMSASFKVSNLLNDLKEQVFQAYEAEDQIFTRLRPQRTFSLGFSYRIF